MAFQFYTNNFHTESYPSIDPSRPELSTAGKVVLITGGGSGIGPRIAHAFATSGATQISILGRTASSLQTTKQEVEAAHAGVTVHTSVADIVDAAAVNAAFASIEKAFGKIDILVSNAAYLPDLIPVAEADVEQWSKGFMVNVIGNMILAQAFLKHASTNPVLVHVSTGAAHAPPFPGNMSAYASSKLAAVKMMDYFAAENPHVRVHNIHPGTIKTSMSDKSAVAGMVLSFDNVELPASFIVWITSPEAEFLKGKFVWSNWDVEELKARKEEYLSSHSLTMGLLGCS